MMCLKPFCKCASLVVTLTLSTMVSTRAPGQTTRTTPPASQPATVQAVKPPQTPGPATSAPSPTDQPSWAQKIADLADQLSSQDLPAVQAALKSVPAINRFASATSQTPDRLLAVTNTAKLLGTHAYTGVPQTLASDLAADFQSAGDAVPESIRQAMVPGDKAVEKRANETAAAWITQVLQPTKDQLVGVLVFWPTERRLAADTSARRAIFVLVKGQPANGSFAIQQITFGDPLESPR
jgi:hypothetical protein